jgi:hypothetical protein
MSLLMACAGNAHAATIKVCVFDPLGTSGEAFRALADYRIHMSKFGADLQIKSYTNEAVAVEDFRSNQCDGVMATALRTRQFNGTAAALDSPGAASILRNGKVDMEASFQVVKRFIGLMSAPKAASLMKTGQYEVAGILPLGAAYAFVNDRSISTLKGAAGKRVAAFENDKSQAELIARVGAVPVAVNIANFSTMFNNGNVDVVIAPSIAYKPLELHKGIGKKGAVAKFPLAILTYQMVIRSDAFPKDFGQMSRDYFYAGIDQAIALARRADKDIPENLWVEPTAAENDQYMVMLRQGRVLMANKGFYDKPGLKLVKKIRCSIEPSAPECSERTETW